MFVTSFGGGNAAMMLLPVVVLEKWVSSELIICVN